MSGKPQINTLVTCTSYMITAICNVVNAATSATKYKEQAAVAQTGQYLCTPKDSGINEKTRSNSMLDSDYSRN